MKTMCEVIWIDDEWEKMDAFKEECEVIHQIRLHPFRTQKAGMDEFDKNPKRWDAIILDAKMLDESENEVPMLVGLRKAIQHINEKSLQRKIPYFISTGQPDLMGNEMFEQSFGAFYIKERDDAKLIEDIKKMANESTRFQVKSFYRNALEQFRSLNDEVYENVLDVLETMHFPNSHPDFTPHLFFNPMRKALEYVFRSAGDVGIIPDEFFSSGNVNLNQCFMFLIGRDAEKLGYRYGKTGERVAPRHIHDMMSLIINLGNSNSHSTELSHPTELTEVEIQKYDNHIHSSGVNSRYLIYSMTLQLCEIVQWMNNYIKDHPNKEDNLKRCVKIEINNKDGDKKNVQEETVTGIVERDRGYYHIGRKYSLNPQTIQNNNWLGKKVRILKWDNNTNNRTKELFPFFAVSIQLVEDEPENGSK